MILNKGYIIRNHLLMSLDGSNILLKLNSSGESVLKKMEKEINYDDLLSLLKEEYGITKNNFKSFKNDVDSFIEILKDKEIISV